MSWRDFEEADPGLASSGAGSLSEGFAFLATTKRDGSPRVHPVTPIVGRGRLFVFMEPTSPKGHDLRRDGRYALHSAVGSPDEGQVEFLVTGRAGLVDDPASREVAAGLSRYPPPDRDVLFEMDVEAALFTTYDGKNPARRRWNRNPDDRVD